jgi:probable phosphoglycerate mutase
VDIILKILAAIGALASIYAAFLQIIRLYLGPTWRDALKRAGKVLADIKQSNWEPTLVIGIGRSGGIWGGWLAGNLGSKPFLGIDVNYQQNDKGREVRFRGAKQVLSALEEYRELGDNILLVEGAASTGQTFTSFLEKFSDQLSSWNIKKAVIYKNPAAAINIEFVGRPLERWPKKLPWHKWDAWRRFL